MRLNLCTLVLSSLLTSRSLAADYVPECNPGQIDAATGSPCGVYGYTKEWVIETKTVDENSGDKKWKYITVNERPIGGTGGIGKWPPPTVSVNVHERIRIKVINKMSDDEAVTLHFHGILQKGGYVTMDGPQGITQSPIRSGESFYYDFPVDNPGTFWIHSHATGQYPKGLRSPLIVKDVSDAVTYTYNKDYTVTISDWWPNFWKTLESYTARDCGKGIEVPPSQIIVNDNAPGWGNALLPKDYSFVIPPNQTARLRFINMSAFARYYIHLDTYQDDITVIEIDGVLIKPVVTKGIEISSGQRVSVTITGAPLANPGPQISRKIIFVSDPRISISKNCQPDLTGLKPSDYTGTAQTQYTWAWIDNVSSDSSSKGDPLSNDMVHGNFNDLKVWKDTDTDYDPYLAGRPRLDFNIPARTDRVKTPSGTKNVQIPDYAWNFNEMAFVSSDTTPEFAAWMVESADENHIHAILLNDTDGFGTMNLRKKDFKSEPTIGFPPTENKYDPSQAGGNGDDRKFTSLLRATRSVNGKGQKYLDVNTYSPWSHTVMLNDEDKVHWFVLRAKRGDHPFHMHGHEFQLLSKIPISISLETGNPYDFDFATYDGKTYYERIFQQVNATRETRPYPARRDTLMIEKGWDYVIGIKSDNPGVWAMHCHNDFHADTGMFMQIIENPKKLRQTLGVWDFAERSCTQCYMPWVSISGSNSLAGGGGVLGTIGGIWGAWAQTVLTSMVYYGCPEYCYRLDYSEIAV